MFLKLVSSQDSYPTIYSSQSSYDYSYPQQPEQVPMFYGDVFDKNDIFSEKWTLW